MNISRLLKDCVQNELTRLLPYRYLLWGETSCEELRMLIILIKIQDVRVRVTFLPVHILANLSLYISRKEPHRTEKTNA